MEKLDPYLVELYDSSLEDKSQFPKWIPITNNEKNMEIADIDKDEPETYTEEDNEYKPQLENEGYFQISRELQKELCKIRISGQERQVLDAIIFKTYGFGKKTDWISLSQFVELTGLIKPHIIRAIKKLLDKNIITKIGNGYKNIYGINKYYTTWKPLPKMITLPKKITTITNIDNDHYQNWQQPLPKLIPTLNNITLNNITKKNITNTSVSKNSNPVKNKKEKQNQEAVEIPSWLNKEIWNNFIEHRKALKKPMTPQAIKLAFKKLEEFKNQGYNPEDVINQSILNGWQGLFEPKRRVNKLPTQQDFELQARNDPECYYAQWGIQLWEVKRAVWKSVKKYTDEQKEKILKKTERRLGKEWWKN
jgi:phage replication O-like protein O